MIQGEKNMEQKKSQINANMIIQHETPMPEKVRKMLGDEFEPRMIQVFGAKENWNKDLTNYWEMFKLAALQSTVPEVSFYNESSEREDDL